VWTGAWTGARPFKVSRPLLLVASAMGNGPPLRRGRKDAPAPGVRPPLHPVRQEAVG
jgi:hypothetical protein